MEYQFLNSAVDVEDIKLPDSDKMHPLLLKSSYAEIIKAIDFVSGDGSFMYVHGFLGTGKRQFINYLADFFSPDVVKLEYYAKESTVCDDILLSFIRTIEDSAISKVVNLNAKISTLNVKFEQYINSIKKPYVIIIHSFDDILDENKQLVMNFLNSVINKENVKVILSTRAMVTDILGDTKIDRKIFLKGFSKDLFKEFLNHAGVTFTDTTFEDFYKYTRGYYYYTALSVKIIQAMKISLNDFLQKFAMSGMNFDSYLGMTYINLIPNTIRNFFWFLRTIRHGITLNALAVFELYDEFSIEYLKANLMIFVSDDTVYVQDYFLQNIDISIPKKTEIKLHKYIIGLYEKQLKEPLASRVLLISRQAMRAEIEYHNLCIQNLEENKDAEAPAVAKQNAEESKNEAKPAGIHVPQNETGELIQKAKKFTVEKNFTNAIETYLRVYEQENLDLHTLIEVRLELARLYAEIGEYKNSEHYYELVEVYYKQHNEVININYLYYEMTSLYFKMYKIERAIETAKKVIYSVDTPQSLMVSACTLLGNIYSYENNSAEAYSYYQKALESLDENTEPAVLAELYFKFALANDDRDDEKTAFEYYTKCITLSGDNPYKALAYSNLGSCNLDNENYSDAKGCFLKAYEIEKAKNNYDGIYYDATKLAEIEMHEKSDKALDYLLEAKQSAEFINEDFYILEATIALGDYYYNKISLNKKALAEYFKARRIAQTLASSVDISKIEKRIADMKMRMDKEVFEEVENKYGQ